MLARAFHKLLIPANERKLLPARRINGPLPWIVGVMMFLTVILMAASIGVGAMAMKMHFGMKGQITVQILAASEQARARDARAALAILRNNPAIIAAAPVPAEEAAALVEPWLGPNAGGSEFPIPALIDAQINAAADEAQLKQLERALVAAAPSARLDRQSDIAAPVSSLLQTLAFIALGLACLLLAAMAALVMLTTRNALNSNREIIDTIHLLGGTDKQVNQLFQRRIFIDALTGGLAGCMAGMLLLSLLSFQDYGGDFGFASGPFIPWYGWLILAILPLLGASLASFIARRSIHSALKKLL